MKRSLILLLVVALLAMMIPSMAVAEDVTFTITGSFTKELVRGVLQNQYYVSAQDLTDAGVTCTVTGLEYGYIKWASSDENAIKANQPTYIQPGSTVFLPELTMVGYTEADKPATITGTLYKDEESVKPLGTASFKVTLPLVKEEKITFYEDDTRTAGKETDKYTIVVGEANLDLRSLAWVTPDGSVEGTKGSTYDEFNLSWSIADSKVATINKYGNVHAVKAGTTTVTATAKGDPTVTATVTITVEEYPEPVADKKAFTKVEFTSKEFTYEAGTYLSLSNYLVTEPNSCDDSITWLSSDTSIATVEGGYVYFEGAKDGDKVEITAKSTLGDKSDTVTITYKQNDPIEKAHFIKNSFKLKMANNWTSVGALLHEDSPADWYDRVIFTSSDPQIINVTAEGTLELKEPGQVTITARSVRTGKVLDTCTAELVREPLKSISFTSDVPKKLKQGNTINLWNYIDTDPYYYAHNVYNYGSYSGYISFVADDPQLVDISGSDVYANKGIEAGTTNITAVYDDHTNQVVKSEPFTLTTEPIPVEEAAFAKSTFTITVGQAIALSAEPYFVVKPYDARGYTRKFESSDPEIAQVYEGSVYVEEYDKYLYGSVVTGLKAGTATITATVRNADGSEKIATCDVTVKDEALTAIAFKKSEYTATLSSNLGANGKYVYMKLTPADADIDWNDIYVESSDPEIAMIDSYGVNSNGAYCYVMPVKPGKVTITVASRSNDTINAKTTVTVKPVEIKTLKFEKKIEKAKLKVNASWIGYNSITVKAKITPADAYYEKKWETSDASVAYVATKTFNGSKTIEPNNGIISEDIILAGPGTCTIKLTVTDGKHTRTRKFKLTVKAAEVSELALNKTTATVFLIKGGDNTLQLDAYDPKTNASVPVIWTTSDKKIATVDRLGKVTFKRAGKAKITATTMDGHEIKKSCLVNVKKLKVKKLYVDTPISLRVGIDKTLKITFAPANAYNKMLSFKSSDPEVVSVDSDGKLTALMPGKAVITVKALDGSKVTAKITVKVKAAAANNGIDIEGTPDLTIDGIVPFAVDDIGGIDDTIDLTIE